MNASPNQVRSSNPIRRVVTAGMKTSMASVSPLQEFCVLFEDDGETGYFYALLASRQHNKILDMVNVYTVDPATDPVLYYEMGIVWSQDGSKAMLLLNGYPQAVFDFQAKRGYCRTNYPNVPCTEKDAWQSEDHSWSDSVCEWFR
jgi:hypothetical protein